MKLKGKRAVEKLRDQREAKEIQHKKVVTHFLRKCDEVYFIK